VNFRGCSSDRCLDTVANQVLVWTPLALPTLKLVQPRMKQGATVVVDNTEAAKAGYKDLIAYLDDTTNSFKMSTVPYSGGLLVAVYTGN
jgi:hypothetical protein